jgi:hypothetical protein
MSSSGSAAATKQGAQAQRIGIAQCADDQRARHLALQLARPPDQRAGGGQHLLGLGQQALASPRQRDAPGPAVEQRDAQLFFQRLDLARDGRLRDVQGFGRARELADLGHRDERTQLVDFHAGAVSA